MSFGENLKKCRTEAGLTQTQLADKLEIIQSNIHRWEAGKVTPTIDTLQRLADALEVSVDKLLVKGEKKIDTLDIL